MSPSLLIFTTTQSPLAIKSPRPHKPVLNLPPLIHRTFHTSFDTSPPSIFVDPESGAITIPHPDTLVKHDVPPNHAHPPNAISDPEISVSQPEAGGQGSAKGDELEAEITVKIHLVAPSPPDVRASWVKDALDTLKSHKGLTEVDTLLIGWRGVDYKGKRTAAADFFGCGAEGLTSDVAATVSDETANEVAETWQAVSEQYGREGNGVKDLGTLYLPLELLQRLNSVSRVGVNSLDTPDCHSLPKEYTQFAKENKIELWAGGGGEGSGESHTKAGTVRRVTDVRSAA